MNEMTRYPAALTIAGSDSGGCAGIQADLKAFSAIGVFGASVITALTAQNTQQVRGVEIVPAAFVKQQLETVLDDITFDAVKTGMLPTPEIIETVAGVIDRYQLKKVVIDPVMVATTGARLASANTVSCFREFLYRRLTVLTPNIPEAEALSGISIHNEQDILKAGEILLSQGCRSVLVKGGHLPSHNRVSDILFTQESNPLYFSSEFVQTGNLHGTGCSLASAITAFLALGHALPEAVRYAKDYITQAITTGSTVTTGKGNGPVNHFFNPVKLTGKKKTPS